MLYDQIPLTGKGVAFGTRSAIRSCARAVTPFALPIAVTQRCLTVCPDGASTHSPAQLFSAWVKVGET